MVKKGGIVIPREHGAWAMVSVPFLFGMMAGHPRWVHAPLFLAWFLFYLSSYPLLQAVRRRKDGARWLRWAALYGAAALVCLIPPLLDDPTLLYFGIPLALLLPVLAWHAKRKSERAIWNDLCGILIFSLGGAAAYLYGGGGWDRDMAAIVLFSFLYFSGTAFFVKSVFRERKNKRWTGYAWACHLLLPFVPLALGYPNLAFAFLFPLARALALAGRAMRPMTIGMIEIGGAAQFLILAVLLFA